MEISCVYRHTAQPYLTDGEKCVLMMHMHQKLLGNLVSVKLNMINLKPQLLLLGVDI